MTKFRGLKLLGLVALLAFSMVFFGINTPPIELDHGVLILYI